MKTLSFERLQTFRRRFAFEQVADGGVVMNLDTGSYFHMNVAAASICAALTTAASVQEVVALVRDAHRFSDDQAVGALETMLDELERTGEPREIGGPFRYHTDGGGYVQIVEGQRTLEVDTASRQIRLVAAPDDLNRPLMEYVKALTPKLLGLLGLRVLHGSACTWASRTVAFSGESRAGKTTTARAFASAGAELLSEDLIVFPGGDVSLSFVVDGEARAHEWAARTTGLLAGAPTSSVSYSDLASIGAERTRPLDEIWFLDARRRADRHFQRRPLGPSQALLHLLFNIFLGEGDAPAWRRHLTNTRRQSEGLATFELTAPRGLDVLQQAAADYVTNSAS